jgi:excisionase family DNA binding protein
MIEWLKPKAGARYSNVGERSFRDWYLKGDLRYVRVGGTVLIKREWIDAFLEAHEVTDHSGKKVDRIVDEIVQNLKVHNV